MCVFVASSIQDDWAASGMEVGDSGGRLGNRVSPDFPPPAIRKPVGKTKEELALEKKRELEKRLQDVSGQLNSTKKPPKKGISDC